MFRSMIFNWNTALMTDNTEHKSYSYLLLNFQVQRQSQGRLLWWAAEARVPMHLQQHVQMHVPMWDQNHGTPMAVQWRLSQLPSIALCFPIQIHDIVGFWTCVNHFYNGCKNQYPAIAQPASCQLAGTPSLTNRLQALP